MKIKLLALAVTTLVSFSSLATTIDYRHEITDKAGNTNADRLLLSNRFANGFGLSLEGKWKGYDDKNKAFNETVSNGTEVVASYLYKFNNTYSIEPGFSLESTSNTNNYRPYVRGKANITDDLSISLRYRPYHKRLNGNVGKDLNTTESGYNLTSVIAYKFLNDYSLEYELDYKKTTQAGVLLSDNENWELVHDVKLAYKFDKNWTPYTAIGNVPGSKVTDERQTRFRVGVAYNF